MTDKSHLPNVKRGYKGFVQGGVLMKTLAVRLGFLLCVASLMPFAPAPWRLAQAELQAQAPAAAVPSGIERVTSVEGITEYRLANGLRLLLFPDLSKQTVTVNITYQVGSRHENYGETGMAHLLEHLMFKGSTSHANVAQELSAHGARANGTTWFDRTNYFETVPATDENLAWALALEADRMVNSFIAKKDLDSEMTVVRNEYERGENNPLEVLLDRMMAAAYLWHNYGKSTIGARSDIENVPIERLQAFYHQYYQPDNAVLLVAGRFDEAKVLALVGRQFGAIPRPSRKLPSAYTIEPTQDGERSVTLRRVGDVQAAAVAYHIPAGSDADFAPLDLLVHLLGDAPSGRLYKALVETKKASNVFSRDYQLHDPGVAIFGAELRTDSSLDAARDALVATVESIAANPPTREEVERARASRLKDIELSLNASDRIGVRLSEWIGMGDWRLLFLHRDRVRKTTLEDVQRVAAKYFKPSNRTGGLFVPTASPDRVDIPAAPEVAALVKEYKGDAAVSAGEAFDPSPASVDARTAWSTVPGGLKLALLAKRTRGASVSATLTIRFGDEASLRNRSTAAQLAGAMLMRGTTKHTRQQVQDELDRLKARVRVNGGATTANATVETTRDNLAAVIGLVAEIMREPSFPTAEFEQLKQQRLAGLEQQRSDPDAIASTALSRHLRPYPKGDVRYVPTVEESIADLKASTLEDVRKFHAEFYGASYGEVAVVGDFDAAQISSAVSRAFGDWRTPRPYRRVPNPFQQVTASTESFQTPDKANAYFLAATNLNVSDSDPDYPALVLGDYLLGGGFLNSRLATRIRQKEGISYSVNSRLQASSLDKSGSFTVFAIYAPENLSRLETAFREEMTRALTGGFTEDEVKAAKAGLLQSRQVGRAQDATLAGRLETLAYLGRTMAWDASLEQKIAGLSPAEIRAALARHIDLARMTIVKAGDFAKTGPSRTAQNGNN
jgi:zinc protease